MFKFQLQLSFSVHSTPACYRPLRETYQRPHLSHILHLPHRSRVREDTAGCRCITAPTWKSEHIATPSTPAHLFTRHKIRTTPKQNKIKKPDIFVIYRKTKGIPATALVRAYTQSHTLKHPRDHTYTYSCTHTNTYRNMQEFFNYNYDKINAAVLENDICTVHYIKILQVQKSP